MSSKVLEGAMGFWVIAVLSLSAISSFDSKITGPSSQLELSSAKRCLEELGILFNEMEGNSTVVVRFPVAPMVSNLSLEGNVLSVTWSSGSTSLEVPGANGDFVVPFSGAVAFHLRGAELEANALG